MFPSPGRTRVSLAHLLLTYSKRGPIMATTSTRNRNARRMTLRDQIKLCAYSWAAGLITWQAGSIIWAATSH